MIPNTIRGVPKPHVDLRALHGVPTRGLELQRSAALHIDPEAGRRAARCLRAPTTTPLSPENALAPSACQPISSRTVPEADPLREAFERLDMPGGPGRVRLLERNQESWNARWQAMKSAEREINVSYFSLERDPFGYAMLGLLLKKREEGVAIRVMTDAMADTFGNRGFKMKLRGQDYLQELVEHGVEIGVYNPILKRGDKIFGDDVAVYNPFKKEWQPMLSYAALASNHDKILEIDGRVSFTGGRNIGREYLVAPEDMPHSWRDTDVIIEGSGAARGLRAAVDIEFESEVNERVEEDFLYNFVKREGELIGAYAMMDIWLNAPQLTAAERRAAKDSPAYASRLANDLVAATVARMPSEGIDRELNGREMKKLREIAAELVTYPAMRGSSRDYDPRAELHNAEVKILDQTSAAGGRINTMAGALEELAAAAQKSIVIENPYVVLTEKMMEAFEEAASRGVEIIIGTNSPLSTDSAVTQAFFLEDWAYILARVPTARFFVATGERKLHAKVATMDDRLSIVSTYNLDLLSGYVNSEVGAAVWSESFNQELMGSFIEDLEEKDNGVVEYLIERDENGLAVLDDEGNPIPVFGPEDHLPPEVLEDYEGRRETWNGRRHWPWLQPLNHPPLRETRFYRK
jgi:putative cardiolipin synthase